MSIFTCSLLRSCDNLNSKSLISVPSSSSSSPSLNLYSYINRDMKQVTYIRCKCTYNDRSDFKYSLFPIIFFSFQRQIHYQEFHSIHINKRYQIIDELSWSIKCSITQYECNKHDKSLKWPTCSNDVYQIS